MFSNFPNDFLNFHFVDGLSKFFAVVLITILSTVLIATLYDVSVGDKSESMPRKF